MDFNPDLYSQLHKAYDLLGKTLTSLDQLHMHVTSAIHNTAWNVVFGHAVLTDSMASDDLAKKPYADLCAAIQSARFVY